MDYALAIGNTPHQQAAKLLYRTGVTMITDSPDLRHFLDRVTVAHTEPVTSLLLYDDGNSAGELNTPAYAGQTQLDYEALERTLDSAYPERSIKIPAALGVQSFHLKVCNVGKARPFLQKLKEALGGTVKVTAPIHYHYLYHLPHYGVWEAMCWQFTVFAHDPFPNKQALVAAFGAEHGTAGTEWDSWVRSRPQVVNVPLGVTIGKRTTIPIHRKYVYVPESTFVYTITYDRANSVPTRAAEQQAALEASIRAHPLCATTHEFPLYTRWGYGSVDKLLSGFTWRFVREGVVLTCTGSRHEYTLTVPVLDGNHNLIFNFYPEQGSAYSAIDTGLREDDQALFATV